MHCTKFIPIEKGCLRGFANLFVEKWGLEIRNLSLNEKNGSMWVSFPSQCYEKDGVKKYSAYLAFDNKDHQTKFMEEALKVILKEKDKSKIAANTSNQDEDIPF